MARDPTTRFSDRVSEYVRYRPRYPHELLSFCQTHLGLRQEHIIADVGSGTGFLSELFLKNGNVVYGVEPNKEMREAGEDALASFTRFHSIDGRAEATNLADQSVDFVTAAQAFHWFDPKKTREEFLRILQPNGFVLVIWSTRAEEKSSFLKDYEELLLKYGTDYTSVDHRSKLGNLELFFGGTSYHIKEFEMSQFFDLEGMTGRLLSSSYSPSADHPNHRPMIRMLRDIFLRHQHEGIVEVPYFTRLYYGQLS